MDLLRMVERGGGGDSMEVRAYEQGQLWIEIDEPWSGSTEGGFGHTATFTLDKDQARQLAAVLLKWADS
jgi:hypothetical protein